MQQQQRDRASLFSGIGTPNDAKKGRLDADAAKRSSSGISNKSTAAEEARSITNSLLRTKAMMKQELDRVSDVTQEIDRDGKLLNETKADHIGLNSIVKNARRTLGLLRRQDMQEAVVLWCAVVIFYLVALYVLWTRIRIPFFLW